MTDSPAPLTTDDIVAMTKKFLAEQGFGEPEVTVDTQLADLGVDSITTVLMLTSAKDELNRAGHTLPEVNPQELPVIEKVGDLATLLVGSAS